MIELQLSQHANVPDALCIPLILSRPEDVSQEKSARERWPEEVSKKTPDRELLGIPISFTWKPFREPELCQVSRSNKLER